jgi:hypothetical protein
LLILAVLFVYRSTRPVMRLSAEAPPAFCDYNRTWNRQVRQHERRLARAYWSVAVLRIQRYYSPHRPLPVEPPRQFQISGATQSLESNMISGRTHYWRRLRQVWVNRDAWVVSYGWNTDWVEGTLNTLPRYLPKSVVGAFQRLVDLFIGIANKISFS